MTTRFIRTTDSVLFWRMARAIIRWSVNGERSNETGNALGRILKDAGFEKIGTASWEASGGSQLQMIVALGNVIVELGKREAQLDHLWTYIDSDPLAT